MNQFEDIANKLIKELAEIQIEAYIWHAATTGSVYIRFKDNRMCSVRIGDHEGKKNLRYKFNLRSDIQESHGRWTNDDGIWRFYLSIAEWRQLIPVLAKRKVDVQNWEPNKYKYKIPSFKQKS